MLREVPEGWRRLKFGDIFRQRVERGRQDLPLLSVTGENGVVLRDDLDRRDTSSADKSRYLTVMPGDLVYNTMRMWQGVSGISSHEGITSPAYTVCEPVPELDSRFAGYLLKMPMLVAEFHSRSQGIVNDTLSLKYPKFAEILLLFPPLHEQRRIAEILSSADDSIAATRAVIEQTRKVRLGVLERLLTRGIGHTRFKQTEIGEIPEGWDVKPVDELCVLSNGNGFRPPDWSDTGLPIIRIQNLNGSQNFNYFNGTPLDKWLIHPGDLLFAWAGVRGVSFGPTIWPGPLGVLNQHIFKISCREQFDKLWLFHMMKLITSRIEAKAHGFKDSLLHVHKKEITGQLVPVPSYAEQVQISAIMGEILLTEDLAAASHQRLVATKSALMSDLITGRKRVADALLMAAE